MKQFVALSLLLIVLGAVALVLVLGKEDDAEPQPSEPVAAQVPPAPELQVAREAPAPVVEVVQPVERVSIDAGTTVDVLFHVVEGRATAAGQRLALRKGQQTVDGLIDVMGHVTLPLEPGVWSVTHPRRTFPVELEVRDSTRELRVDVLDPRNLEVTGAVLDNISKPRGVPGATVVVSDGFIGYHLTTDLEGGFRVTIPGADSLTLFATDGQRRSERVSIDRAHQDSAILVLESTTSVTVTVVGPGAEFARIRVRDRAQAQVCREKPCTLQVLGGSVAFSASTTHEGQYFVANKVLEIETAKSSREVVLQLRPAPPLRGTLFGPGGALLPGVSLELRAFTLEPIRRACEMSDGDGPLSRPAPGPRLAATITASDGSFELPWPGVEFATFHVGPLYALDREVIVAPGDAPLLLSAHPVGADAQ